MEQHLGEVVGQSENESNIESGRVIDASKSERDIDGRGVA
jgi:hypothetical protein